MHELCSGMFLYFLKFCFSFTHTLISLLSLVDCRSLDRNGWNFKDKKNNSASIRREKMLPVGDKPFFYSHPLNGCACSECVCVWECAPEWVCVPKKRALVSSCFISQVQLYICHKVYMCMCVCVSGCGIQYH